MRTDVSFPSAGLKIAAHLYMPDAPTAQPRPAIIVGHPGSAVKEQTAGLYARHLADQGFITLAFDAAHQGESEGLPRGLEDPAQRVEDFKAATSYLSALDTVDPARIGALGICASGGYVIAAAATDTRIRAVATVSAADIGRHFRHGADGTLSPAVLRQMLDAATTARTAEARGDGMGALPLFPATADEAQAQGRHAFEGYEYYCTDRGRHPRSAKTLTWSSIDRIAAFDAFRFIDMIAPRPLLLVVGSEAVTAWMAQEAFRLAREPKQWAWIEGATHVDLYDREVPVTAAVEKLSAFFAANLAGRDEVG
ncbi:alpha/beta hydrolase [Nitrospirillum sp. BR 11163]|uniref:alpha/beta hydrolase n=1 Tax=Nitrospirillum sp. BR 11163 TaxID=3104323 RepID=UPI002AFEF86A|nr:alpha/beta hydrolase [Nitrospirillum sp. BR 11163]MEA1675993.1 alpha/beta hydrolase [Nitrospirillum sp. BR 11163]